MNTVMIPTAVVTIPSPTVGLIRPELFDAVKRFLDGPKVAMSSAHPNYASKDSWQRQEPTYEFWRLVSFVTYNRTTSRRDPFNPLYWDNVDVICPYLDEIENLKGHARGQLIAWSELYITFRDITDAMRVARRGSKIRALRAAEVYQTSTNRILFWRDYMGMTDKQIVHLMVYAATMGGFTNTKDKTRAEEAMILAFLDLNPNLTDFPNWLLP